jgi:hypothetical protein
MNIFKSFLKLLDKIPVSPKAYITVPGGGVGYRGWLKVDGVMIPVKSCTIEQTPFPIIGEDLIHGSASEPNAASAINYAEGRNEYGGEIGTDLFGSFWTTLANWVVTDRHASLTVVASPNNQDIYTYTEVYVDSCTITGNLQGAVGVRLNVKAKTRTAAGTVGTAASATVTGALNKSPIPWWKTAFVGTSWGAGDWASFGGSAASIQVVGWEVTINNNTIQQFTFDGTKDPHYIQQSILRCTGSITAYSTSGVPVPSDGGSAVITITGAGTITLPYLVITGRPMAFVAPGPTKVTRTVNFTSLGTDLVAAVVMT